MRVNRFTLAITVCAGLALLAGRAHAGFSTPFVDTTFFIANDANDPNANFCEVGANGPNFGVNGTVAGTAQAVAVSVDYFTFQPTSASRSSNKVSVKQGTFSALTFHFDATAVTTSIEKCSISGSVNRKKSPAQGSASVNCKGDNVFGVLTSNQVAQLQAAFDGNKNVKVKVNTNKGHASITIKCKGEAVDED